MKNKEEMMTTTECLDICLRGECSECPYNIYYNCRKMLIADTKKYINKLMDDIEELEIEVSNSYCIL